MTPPQLEKQMLRMLDGELSADEAVALEAELVAAPDARSRWWQLVRLHSALESRFASEATIQQLPVVPIKRVIAMQKRRMVKITLTAAAAILMLTTLTLWMIMTVDIRPAMATLQTAPNSSYSIIHKDKARKKSANQLHEGSRLTLTHGVAELDLPYDVRAVIQAPASLTLLDSRTLQLDHGQVFFEVRSTAGQGFTVVTPHQRIVDLGTAFGVIAPRDSEQVDLHVFNGRVRIDSLDNEPGEIIPAGRSVRLTTTHISAELENARAAFLRDLPEKIETLLHDNFSTGLAADREYAVIIDHGVIQNEFGEAFVGIHENASWSFRTGSAAPANIPVRNAGFEDDGVERSHGATIAHWQHGDSLKQEWGWGVDARRGSLAPTEGRFFGRVFHGRSLHQTTGETILPGTTYVLTLDVGLSNSTAIVRLHGSDPDDVLAEATFHSAEEKWLRNQSLIFTADASHATGQKLGISLTCSDGSFAAFDRIRLGIPGHDALDGFVLTQSSSSIEKPEVVALDNANTPPQIIDQLPALGATSATPGGPLVLQFDQPIKFGRGRIRIRNITDWSETTLAVGDPRLVIADSILYIHPPLELADGELQMGRVPGWQSTGWTGLRNSESSGGGHPRTFIVATLDAAVPSTAIRRAIGVIQPGHRYSASIALRHRDAPESPGYTVRLVSGNTVFAERTGHTLPGGGETVTLAWDSSELPAGITRDDTLSIEIAPARQTPGHLEIEEVRVTAVDLAGARTSMSAPGSRTSPSASSR